MALPHGFVPLRDVLQGNEDSCFIGAITHIQAPVPSDQVKGDYVMHFAIRDKFPGDEKDSVACILKREKREWLPTGDPGDIAILRGMKIEIHGLKNTKTLVNDSELQSQALFFPSKSIPAHDNGHLYQMPFKLMKGSQAPSSAERMSVIAMKSIAAPLLEDLKDPKAMFLARLGPNAARAKRGKRQSLISGMTFNLFYDLVGEVVKTFWSGDAVDLYVTDYTTNTDLFLYEEKTEIETFGGPKKPWPGPFGQMTIQVRCYEPHAGAARDLKEGDFVFLQNIRTKMSQSNKLEGAIHEDPQYPKKIGVRKCTHQAQLGELLTRKAEYEGKWAGTLLHQEESNAPKKSSAIAPAKKKLSKKEKKRLQREQEQRELQQKADELEETAIKGLNKNICAGDKDVGLSTVDEIVNNPYLKTVTELGKDLSLPFVNSRYRTRLRIVDHWPNDLANFCRHASSPQTSQASGSTPSDNGSHMNKDFVSPVRFEWHFFLLAEDADPPKGSTPLRFPLTFDTPRAQCLLDMNPCDLSTRPLKLGELREKLFVVWGNLHERKQALKQEGIDLPLLVADERLKLSNMPFECCVEEYGVPISKDGIPYSDDQIDALIKDMETPDTEAGKLAAQILGNPKTWKRTWSPYNTTIRKNN